MWAWSGPVVLAMPEQPQILNLSPDCFGLFPIARTVHVDFWCILRAHTGFLYTPTLRPKHVLYHIGWRFCSMNHVLRIAVMSVYHIPSCRV